MDSSDDLGMFGNVSSETEETGASLQKQDKFKLGIEIRSSFQKIDAKK